MGRVWHLLVTLSPFLFFNITNFVFKFNKFNSSMVRINVTVEMKFRVANGIKYQEAISSFIL